MKNKKINKERFRQNLRTLRSLKGLNQLEACRELGLSQGTYSQYEAPRLIFPSAQVLVSICELFDTTFEILFFSNDIVADYRNEEKAEIIEDILRRVIREELKAIK